MQQHTRRLAAAALVSVVAASSLAGCRSSDASAENGDAASGRPQVTIMVGGIDKVIYLPAMLTQQLGYFDDEGVDVKLLTEPSGASAENVLVAGQVQGVVGFYDHTITLQAQGKCVESVVQLAKVPGEAEVVATKAGDLTSADQFSGKKLGVTTPGAGSTFIAALENGGIDAGMTTDPTIATAVDKGLGKVMIDMRTEEGTKAALGGLYPAASLYMTCDYVEQNPKTVQKLADAFVKTMQWISKHTLDEIEDQMPKDNAGDDEALY